MQDLYFPLEIFQNPITEPYLQGEEGVCLFSFFFFLIKPLFNQSEQSVFTHEKKKKKSRNSVQVQSPDGIGELGRENEDGIKMQETKMCTL